MKRILLVSAIVLATLSANAQSEENSRIDSLVSRMTLDEMLGQMNQISCDSVDGSLLDSVRKGRIGSILNVVSPSDVLKLQKAASESRHSIPLIIGRDVIHGFKTVFPIPLGQAASFDPALVGEAARISAREATSVGVRWTFAPMMDISRDARWGRIAESSGEDTYLTSLMAASATRGFQGDDTASNRSLAACAKHFVGYGAAEGGRDYNSVSIGDNALFNTYLPPFKSAIDAGALTVMSSFNDNDGIPTTANHHLLTDVLHDSLGFRGMTVSDWNAVGELVVHGYASDGEDAARKACMAGIDMEMNTGLYLRYIKELVEDGTISRQAVEDHVRKILRVKYEMGLFSNSLDIPATAEFYSDEALSTARKLAAESMVLLKNDGEILPLGRDKRIGVLGPLADAPADQLGTWSMDGDAARTQTPLAALRDDPAFSGIDFRYCRAMDGPLDSSQLPQKEIGRLARWADVLVVFVGEEARFSGEAHSLSDLDLKGSQSGLVSIAKQTGKPVVLVVMAGRPLIIGRDLENADAALYCFHPGTMGGPALLDVLFGDFNPEGRLPVTFPKTVGQLPLYYNHYNTGRPAPDNQRTIYDLPGAQTSAGDVSTYLDSGSKPLFPFGYGLSYTSFAYSGLSISSSELSGDGSLEVSVKVTNTGRCAGVETVQLYIRHHSGSVIRPVAELKAFRKLRLASGETADVRFTLSAKDLAFWSASKGWHGEAGEYSVMVGHDSTSLSSLSFRYCP